MLKTDRLFTRSAAPAAPPSDLAMRAFHVRVATVNEEQRTVEAVLSTDRQAMVFDADNWRIIDETLRIEGAQHGDQVPLLEAHRRSGLDNVLGSIRDIRREDGRLVGRLHLASGDETAERAWQKIRQGHLTDVSIGYRADEFTDIKPGQTQRVAGKDYTAGQRTLRVTTKFTVKEGSLVPIGADPDAKIREQPQEIIDMNKHLRAYLESLGLKHDADEAAAWEFYNGLEGNQKTRASGIKSGAITPSYDDDAEPEPQPAKREEPKADGERVDPDAIRRAERERIDAINERADAAGVDDELRKRAIDGGWTKEQASDEFLKARRAARPDPVAPAGHAHASSLPDNADQRRQAVEDVMAMSIGIDLGDEKRHDTARRHARWIDSQPEMARHCLQLDGVTERMTGDALFERAVSTYTFPKLLGNIANKVLGTAFNEAPSTAVVWCGQRDLNNFQTHTHIRTSNAENLEQIGKAGQFPNAQPEETYEEMTLATYGQRLTFARNDWVNDDMSGLRDSPRKMGRAARRKIDDVAYEELLSNPTMNEDSNSLFSASHSNSNYTASSGALASATLTSQKALMRKQIGMKSEHLNLMPAFLIVPPELEGTALELVRSSLVVDGTATAKTPNINIHQGSLTVVVEPRLSAGVGGQSGDTDAWYLATNYSDEEHIAIGYLRGMRSPTIERKDPQDVLGIGWWVYFDVCAQAVGWRGMVKSAGA